MGISDEEYASAIEQHMQAHKAYLEKQKEEARMGGAGVLTTDTTGRIISNVTLSNTASPTWIATGTNGLSNVSMTQSGSKILNEQDLKHDAMQAPLSALVDMWTMRWQGTWVSETEFAEDDFWRLALIRLVGANKLEKHHLANQYAAVYRIIE